MQKTLTLMALAICVQGFGQKEVVSAYNANKEGDFATAATYIEQAIQNPKANVKNKTWRYRGEIYLNISTDSALFAAYPNALTVAKDSFLKAMELDSKGSYESEIRLDWARFKWRQQCWRDRIQHRQTTANRQVFSI